MSSNNLQQKRLIATLKGSSEKIIENIRYNLKILEQCSVNIDKVCFYLLISFNINFVYRFLDFIFNIFIWEHSVYFLFSCF